MIPDMTKKELAEVAGYTYRRLYDIDKGQPDNQKLFVESKGGKYDLALFVQRWVRYNVNNETSDIDDLDTVKARHEIVKTQKTELEVAKLRGQLVEVQDVKKLWGDIANTVMQNLIHLPSKLAQQLRMMESQEKIAAILDEGIRQVLNEIAETPLPEYAADEPSEDEEDEE